MSYITEIFDRLDLQRIRGFLLHGVECCEVSRQTYKQRLSTAEKTVSERMEENFPDIEQQEKLMFDIHRYAGITQEVYMEIGMQCGAVLAMQLLFNPQKE